MGLGPVSVRRLADARSLVTGYRSKLLDGIDPIDDRHAERAKKRIERAKLVTFDQAAAACIEAKAPEWENAKHSMQWTNTLATYASPAIGSLPINSITTEAIYQLLQPIWLKKTETATRVRQRIEVVWDWAKARGYCDGENPARLKGALGELLPKAQKVKRVVHHPALPYQQIRQFVADLRTLGGAGPLAFELLILTATRTNEVTAAEWDEFDLQTKVWTIPGERMKAGKEHRVPLSLRATQILLTMRGSGSPEYVFPSHSIAKGGHLSNGVFLAIMKKLPQYCDYTPHGFRSTFRDWASETTGFANETIELALAHVISNKTEAAYRRQDQLEKRRKLMELWEMYLSTPNQTATVTALTQAKAKNRA
jgi:integrase